MTTTEASLDRVDDIINEYLDLGLDGIFLRPLSPFDISARLAGLLALDAKRCGSPSARRGSAGR
jgi:uncharacterized protein